jgi:hypothetical protein
LSAYNPGSQYYDIVGFDAYPPGAGDDSYYKTLGKPVILCECGTGLTPLPSTANSDYNLVKTVQSRGQSMIAMPFWTQDNSIPFQASAASMMNDPTIIRLDNLPAGL